MFFLRGTDLLDTDLRATGILAAELNLLPLEVAVLGALITLLVLYEYLKHPVTGGSRVATRTVGALCALTLTLFAALVLRRVALFF